MLAEAEDGHRAGAGEHRLADLLGRGLVQRRRNEPPADGVPGARRRVARRAVLDVQAPPERDVPRVDDDIRDRRPVPERGHVRHERLDLRITERGRLALGPVARGAEGHAPGAQHEVGRGCTGCLEVRPVGRALALGPVAGRAGLLVESAALGDERGLVSRRGRGGLGDGA